MNPSPQDSDSPLHTQLLNHEKSTAVEVQVALPEAKVVVLEDSLISLQLSAPITAKCSTSLTSWPLMSAQDQLQLHSLTEVPCSFNSFLWLRNWLYNSYYKQIVTCVFLTWKPMSSAQSEMHTTTGHNKTCCRASWFMLWGIMVVLCGLSVSLSNCLRFIIPCNTGHKAGQWQTHSLLEVSPAASCPTKASILFQVYADIVASVTYATLFSCWQHVFTVWMVRWRPVVGTVTARGDRQLGHGSQVRGMEVSMTRLFVWWWW